MATFIQSKIDILNDKNNYLISRTCYSLEKKHNYKVIHAFKRAPGTIVLIIEGVGHSFNDYFENQNFMLSISIDCEEENYFATLRELLDRRIKGSSVFVQLVELEDLNYQSKPVLSFSYRPPSPQAL